MEKTSCKNKNSFYRGKYINKHLSQKGGKKCKSYYTNTELVKMEKEAKMRKIIKKKKTYNKEKRRDMYLKSKRNAITKSEEVIREVDHKCKKETFFIKKNMEITNNVKGQGNQKIKRETLNTKCDPKRSSEKMIDCNLKKDLNKSPIQNFNKELGIGKGVSNHLKEALHKALQSFYTKIRSLSGNLTNFKLTRLTINIKARVGNLHHCIDQLHIREKEIATNLYLENPREEIKKLQDKIQAEIIKLNSDIKNLDDYWEHSV